MTSGSTSVSRVAIIDTLRAAGCVFAEDEADLLLSVKQPTAELAAMVKRRAGGEPLEYVLGFAAFCGLRIMVDAGVFVPRRRSEFLALQAAALATPGAIVVDLCCGAGAIGAVVASRVPDCQLYAADIEPAAVRCARRNLEPGGGHVFEGDLYQALPSGLRGRVQVLVANAPYVPSDAIDFMPPEARDYEPLITLDGGADGLDIQRRVIASASEWLAPGGRLLIETSERQSAATSAAFTEAGLSPRIARDEDLDATMVIGAIGVSGVSGGRR
jgi:release factor glutamine methyltransferase